MANWGAVVKPFRHFFWGCDTACTCGSWGFTICDLRFTRQGVRWDQRVLDPLFTERVGNVPEVGGLLGQSGHGASGFGLGHPGASVSSSTAPTARDPSGAFQPTCHPASSSPRQPRHPWLGASVAARQCYGVGPMGPDPHGDNQPPPSYRQATAKPPTSHRPATAQPPTSQPPANAAIVARCREHVT